MQVPQSAATFVVLLCCLTSASAFLVITGGSCPRIRTVRYFDVTKYLGPWYSYENFDVPYQFGASCVRALYSPSQQPKEIKVLNTGVRRIGDLKGGYHTIENMRAEGKAEIINSGGLKVSFGQPDIFDSDGPNYLILYTDYYSYSIVYSCTPIGPWLKWEQAWVLTREPGVKPFAAEILKKNLKLYGIDISYFKKIDHDQCNY